MPRSRSTENKDYIIKIFLSDSVNTIRFYGTELEMMRFVDNEARSYCVRGIKVTHKNVACYTKVNLNYNFDEKSDNSYLDFYDIFPQVKKMEDRL